jgi:hypothetical protein
MAAIADVAQFARRDRRPDESLVLGRIGAVVADGAEPVQVVGKEPGFLRQRGKDELQLAAQQRKLLGSVGGLDVRDEHPQDPKKSRDDLGLGERGLPQLVEGVVNVLVVTQLPGPLQRPAGGVAHRLGRE